MPDLAAAPVVPALPPPPEPSRPKLRLVDVELVCPDCQCPLGIPATPADPYCRDCRFQRLLATL